jgi:hypothetical protein
VIHVPRTLHLLPRVVVANLDALLIFVPLVDMILFFKTVEFGYFLTKNYELFTNHVLVQVSVLNAAF